MKFKFVTEAFRRLYNVPIEEIFLAIVSVIAAEVLDFSLYTSVPYKLNSGLFKLQPEMECMCSMCTICGWCS